MPKTVDHQPDAGRIVRARREALGLGLQDLCDLVSQQSTKWGRVNVDRTTLWLIENRGVVPLPPRRRAIAQVLGCKPADIWETPGSRLVSAFIDQERTAA